MGRFQVTYQADIQDGREIINSGIHESIEGASSFTTFDKQDRPSTQVRHKARGDDKDREKDDKANASAGTS
jgi:hypothetical protein